jgi:hypothetical protein
MFLFDIYIQVSSKLKFALFGYYGYYGYYEQCKKC